VANSRRVLIDTNLLVLWITGHVAPHVIGSRRTAHYTLDDFYLLDDHLQEYDEFLTTPGVAAEVSNLIGSLEGKYRRIARAILQERLQVWEEVYAPSRELSLSPAFLWAGLTDVGIRSAARDAITVLTDDGPLYAWLHKEGVQVLNFTNLRFPRS
jgi:rRNA-processing protein FCF1